MIDCVDGDVRCRLQMVGTGAVKVAFQSGKAAGTEMKTDAMTGSYLICDRRNVSTTLRQWHLDFRLGFLPFALEG